MRPEDRLFAAAFICGLSLLFFIPSYVAFRRRHRNAPAILVLNLCLFAAAVGCVIDNWPNAAAAVIGVGLVIALVWSSVAVDRPNLRAEVRSAPTATHFRCPFCAAFVRVPLELVGSTVPCGSCGGTFYATPPASC